MGAILGRLAAFRAIRVFCPCGRFPVESVAVGFIRARLFLSSVTGIDTFLATVEKIKNSHLRRWPIWCLLASRQFGRSNQPKERRTMTTPNPRKTTAAATLSHDPSTVELGAKVAALFANHDASEILRFVALNVRRTVGDYSVANEVAIAIHGASNEIGKSQPCPCCKVLPSTRTGLCISCEKATTAIADMTFDDEPDFEPSQGPGAGPFNLSPCDAFDESGRSVS